MSGSSYGKVAKIGALWSFAREGVIQLIALPTAVVLARLLTPEEFGVAAAASFFLMMANRLVTLGLNAALVRIPEVRPEHTSSVFVSNMVLGVAVWLTLTAAAPAIGQFYRSPEASAIVPVAALSFLIIPFGSVPIALLHRDMRFRDVATVNWAASLTFSLTAPLLAWYGWSYWSLVYAQLAANVTQTATKLYLAKWRPTLRFSFAAMGEVFPFGAGVYAKRLLEYITLNLDSLIVGRALGITALGYYDKAFNTMDRFLTRFSVGPGVSFRVFALLNSEPERFSRAYRKVMLAVSLGGLPVFAGLLVAGPQIVPLLFGDQWHPSIVPFQILCAVGGLKLLNTYASSATQALGRVWSEVWRQLAYAGLLVVGIAIGSRWGIDGAAAGVLGATVVMTILMQSLMRSVTGWSWTVLTAPFVPSLVCSVAVAAAMLGATWGIRSIAPDIGNVPLLTGQVAAAAVVYLAFVLLSGSPLVRALVDEVIDDFAPRLARFLPRHSPRQTPSAAAMPGVGPLAAPATSADITGAGKCAGSSP